MKSKEFQQQLAAYADSLRQKIEAQFDGWDDNPQAVALRRKQVLDPESGLAFFINHYFPHYVRSSSKSQLHHYLFDRLPKVFATEKGCLEAIAAPRGEAKSTIVTQLTSLWCLVTQQKRYILLVMDSIDQAYPMLEAIKSELEFNQRLRIDFPEISGVGRVWQSGTIITKANQKVQVAGSGKKLRGLRHGAYRPDLVILDDIENDEQARIDFNIEVKISGSSLSEIRYAIQRALAEYFNGIIPADDLVVSQCEAVVSDLIGVVDRRFITPTANRKANLTSGIEWFRLGNITVSEMR